MRTVIAEVHARPFRSRGRPSSMYLQQDVEYILVGFFDCRKARPSKDDGAQPR